MTTYKLPEIEEKEIIPGYFVKLIHSERMTIANFRIIAGAPAPLHSHPHEQICNVLEGKFDLTVDGVTHHMEPGYVVIIPPDIPHSGIAITDCRVMDVFAPTREDYRFD
jgi:quercetin dioxygenase-like cupin family protein